MLEVVRRHICEIHPANESKVEGFKFYWPESGETFEIEPCEECLDPIMEALRPFVQVSKGVSRDELAGVAQEPKLVDGSIWMLARNEAQKGASGGIGKAHITTDRISSRCGLVSRADRWVGPAPADAERCKACVKFANADKAAAAKK